MRKLKDISIIKVKEKCGNKIYNVSAYERDERTPYVSTVFKLASAIEADPEVLFYSFGVLPPDITEIIKSDPFYYAEKIKELCDNHKSRYGVDVEVDLNDLNRMRSINYLFKEKGDG